MRRRDFIRVVAGLGVAWPLAIRAQAPAGKIYRLGILQPAKPPEPLVDALIERLKELGYREGRNIVYEYRWAEGKLDRFPELAKQLVDLKVDVITVFTTPGAIAAKNATKTIPIVFGGVGDPVGAGVVPSLSHPGGNITGISILATELSAKRLEILKEIVPNAAPVAMFWK
jgi:putative ABC transport system substrate-binding protein